MANVSVTNATKVGEGAGTERSYTGALAIVTTLFFMWGFLTCLNDILVPHLKSIFDLNYAKVMLVQFAFFGAYAVFSIPSAKLIDWIGYQRSMVVGLLTMGLGAFLFVPAASVPSFWLFLGALIVLAAGITCLQVAANPYVTVLGKPETASSRLNLTQAFNSLGTFLAPFFGGLLILSAAAKSIGEIRAMPPDVLQAYRLHEAATVKAPYVGLGIALVVLAIAIGLFKLPKIEHAQHKVGEKVQDSIWKHPNLVFGAIAIFVYVGAEVSIGSFLVNYFHEPNIAGLAEKVAASFVAFYWGGAMLGRFIGSNFLGGAKAKYMWLVAALSVALSLLSYPIGNSLPAGYEPGVPNLTWLGWLVFAGRPLFILVAIAAAAIALVATLNGGKATAHTGLLLGICALATSVLVAISMLASGHLAMWSIILVGFFNSIMFPSIFTLGVAELGPLTGDGSGVMIMAIVGGAIIPLLQGWIADRIGIHHAFFLPVICYLYILFFALSGSKPNSERYPGA
jgi:MFS transporter, FHS family, L-fucose permease